MTNAMNGCIRLKFKCPFGNSPGPRGARSSLLSRWPRYSTVRPVAASFGMRGVRASLPSGLWAERKNFRRSGFVPVDVPTEIARCRFVDSGGYRGKIGCDVMFETSLANEAQQLLQFRDSNDACAPKGFKGILGESAFADIAGDFSFAVIGGKPREAHRAAFHASHASAKSVLLADRSSDDFLEVHADVLEEMFRQVAAVEAHRFVWIIGIIVVPIQQSARCL